MLFYSYYVNYLDVDGVSLGTHEVSIRTDAGTNVADYTVNMGYTSPDTTHNFEGWILQEGGSNIVGEAQEIYQNETPIQITGDIVFGVTYCTES